MIRTTTTLLAALGLAGTAIAADCPLASATYAQPDTKWEMRFMEVPRWGAANQLHAFTIAIPGTDKSYLGGVYAPNGFTPALGVLDRSDCDVPDDAEGEEQRACQAWEGPVYMNDADGIDWLAERDASAPAQILLPGFGSAWWYSDLRDPDNVPLDVFTYIGCST